MAFTCSICGGNVTKRHEIADHSHEGDSVAIMVEDGKPMEMCSCVVCLTGIKRVVTYKVVKPA